jgi:hypothetical protein
MGFDGEVKRSVGRKRVKKARKSKQEEDALMGGLSTHSAESSAIVDPNG